MGLLNFSTQCTCMGIESLFVSGSSSFSWKGTPSTKENRICGSVNAMVKVYWHIETVFLLGVVLLWKTKITATIVFACIIIVCCKAVDHFFFIFVKCSWNSNYLNSYMVEYSTSKIGIRHRPENHITLIWQPWLEIIKKSYKM